MPRLPNSLLRHAYAIDPHLVPLLRPCREISVAQNELRWLREHAIKTAQVAKKRDELVQWRTLLRQLVQDRATGKPLQYVLGTEFFGDLELRVRKGVLIPRQETAASVTHLAHLIRRAQSLPLELRVLDLCTGSGCIPFLFKHEFAKAGKRAISVRALGVDISTKAIGLAKHNLRRMRKGWHLDPQIATTTHKETSFPNSTTGSDEALNAGREDLVLNVTRKSVVEFPAVGHIQSHSEKRQIDSIEFIRADVLVNPTKAKTLDPPSFKAALNFHDKPPFWDILTSNPPYISPAAYWNTTAGSVRRFEPKLALVPPNDHEFRDIDQSDIFYSRILIIAREVEAKVVLLEVADLDQAIRVTHMAREMQLFDGIEIWRDSPDLPSSIDEEKSIGNFDIIGRGNARSIVCWREQGIEWLGKGSFATSHPFMRKHFS